MTRSLLICVDDSIPGEAALKWTFNTIVADSDKVTVLTVVRPNLLLQPEGRVLLPMGEEDMALTAIQSLAHKTIQETGKHVELTCKVMAGDPRSVICSMGSELGVDLIVVGNRGMSVLQKSNSLKLVCFSDPCQSTSSGMRACLCLLCVVDLCLWCVVEI